MKERAPISDDLVAKVMFASDRTCCVCRLENHKIQIHHIDENPSNNGFDNLAVICLHCHSDAHTTGAFVRNLTPELIHLYNSSWRDIVKLRLLPSTGSNKEKELLAEAFLEASLDCHSWKVLFMTLTGSNLPGGKPGEFQDVWDAMAKLWIPKYTVEAYKHYLPLFEQGLEEVQHRFDRLIQIFADILPYEFRAILVRAHRQLDVEKRGYMMIPSLITIFSPDKSDFLYRTRFTSVIGVLREIARDADRRRENLIEGKQSA